MSKVVKKVVKGAAKVVKKIFKEAKRFLTSDLGKVLLVSAAVFTGGVAMGFWKGPAWLGGAGATAGASSPAGAVGQTAAVSAADTAAVSGASQVLAGSPNYAQLTAPAASQGVSASAVGAATGAGGAAAPVPSGIPALEAGGQSAVAAQNAQTAAGTVGGAAPSVGAPSVAAPGVTVPGVTGPDYAALTMGTAPAPNTAGAIISRIRDIGAWTKDNQLVAAMGLNAVANAFTPSPAEQAQELEEDRLRRANRNWEVSGVDVGGNAGSQPLRRPNGSKVYSPSGGLINSKMGRG